MSGLIAETPWMIPVSVFLAGLIGSPHCAAMCGPLAMTIGRDKKRLVMYQFGRMASYTAAGSIAGSIGSLALRSHQASTLAVIFLSTMLVIFGYQTFFSKDRGMHFQWPGIFADLSKKVWSLLRRTNPVPTSFLAGVFTVFLPCAHLYAFITGASLSNSALGGAVFMWVFWLSTLPALGFAPLLLKRFVGRRMAALLFCAAAISLIGFAVRLDAKAETQDQSTQTQLRCH